MRRRWLLAFPVVAAAASAPILLSPPAVPPAAIAAAVSRAPVLMARASRLPVAASFGGSLDWQSNKSLCGPASLANVFRSLGEPAISERAVLAGTGKCWSGYCLMGLTLDELAGVARAHTRRSVTVLRNLTPEQFRLAMMRSNDPRRRYIVNFDRAKIFGAGGGHHSPIGGYLPDRDLVLVLDVNRDFRPWLIERTRLFAAIDTIDGDRKRGLLLIE